MLFSLLFSAFMTLIAHATNFDERKSEVLKEIDERIAKMQEHRGCVSAATDPAAMEKCRESMREFRHDNKMERMEKRRERMKDKQKE